ncbi:hypothetical protein HGRIS_013651 [Hohenbuehelia grisea]
MREYFHVEPFERPKIFGMTASPIWDPNKAAASLAELESNMDSQILSVKENIEELLQHVPKPSEIIHEYPPAPKIYPEYPTFLLSALQAFVPLYAALDIPWSNIETRYTVTLYSIGPYCAELYVFEEMRSRLAHALDLATVTGRFVDSEALDVQSILEDYMAFFVLNDSDPLISSGSFSTLPKTVPLAYCTPKVESLVTLLIDHQDSFTSPSVPTPTSSPPRFQAIIFVDQRQIAVALARVLPCIPELSGRFRCAELLGQGTGLDGGPKGLSGSTGGTNGENAKKDVVKMFRDGELDILIATSVAEEGLDFPACSLIIRFDPLQHMVGYVQSRGRARSKVDSKFIVMIQQNDESQIARYRLFAEAEPEIRRIWEERGHRSLSESCHDAKDVEADPDDGDDDGDNEHDRAGRERYVVPETGAVLSYDNAIDLLNHLCALIPCDQYTSTHLPKYLISCGSTGPSSCDAGPSDYASKRLSSASSPPPGFTCTIRLPPPLPLSQTDLLHIGPPKQSKREAKRATAFCAVKALRELDVFDEYLLPAAHGKARGYKGSLKGRVDTDGRGYVGVSDVQVMMDVAVRDPWGTLAQRAPCTLSKQWIQPICVDGRRVAGLITDSWLPSCVLPCSDGQVVCMGEGVNFDPAEASFSDVQLDAHLERYTARGIWYCVTGRVLAAPLPFSLVPLLADDDALRVDWQAVARLAENPVGCEDWSSITPADYGHLLVENSNQHGRTLRLVNVRSDLHPLCKPPVGTREESGATYHEYWKERWSRKTWEARVPTEGPLLEVSRVPKRDLASYDLYQTDSKSEGKLLRKDPEVYLVPKGCCRWIPISEQMRYAFTLLPQLSRRITDIYRASCARLDLGLPAISTDLLVEAFTIPSASMPFNNQRLETLGDSVLKLCVSVHAFKRYPHRHEGQLSALRQTTVSNWCLLARARELGLERYLISERHDVRSWEYANTNTTKGAGGSGEDDSNEGSECDEGDVEWEDGDALPTTVEPQRAVTRTYPRRSLQDCMEATLGAAFLTGGFPMALRAGQSLGLSFGGIDPWPRRYAGHSPNDAFGGTSALFHNIESNLGYTFHRKELLLEAVTHPSFASDAGGSSYQRLEFLGDAVVDLVVMKYLYTKFPRSTSDQLSWPRTRSVCSAALAWVAVTRLDIHKVILANSVELSMAVEQSVPPLQACCAAEIVTSGWRHDPPKTLSDVLESIVGAVLVDSGWDYDRVEAVVEFLMEDILAELSPSLRRDPVSELILWMDKKGCKEFKYTKTEADPVKRIPGGVLVAVHGLVVAGPMHSASMNTAKFAAAEKALEVLQKSGGEYGMAKLCDCANKRESAKSACASVTLNDEDAKKSESDCETHEV